MSSNVAFFAWNRSIPGRERTSGEHFQEFVTYLEGLQKNHKIQSYDVVFLNPHGGDLNGFFLIRGANSQLTDLISSSEWTTHMTRAGMHLEGSGNVLGVTGDMVMERMALWTKNIPA